MLKFNLAWPGQIGESRVRHLRTLDDARTVHAGSSLASVRMNGQFSRFSTPAQYRVYCLENALCLYVNYQKDGSPHSYDTQFMISKLDCCIIPIGDIAALWLRNVVNDIFASYNRWA